MAEVQFVVVGPGDFLGLQRPHLAAVVDALVAGDEFVDGLGGEEAGEGGARTGQAVAGFRVVGHAAPGTDVQHGFLAGGEVAQFAVGWVS